MRIALIALAALFLICLAAAIVLFETMLTRRKTTEPGEDDAKKESSAWLAYRRHALACKKELLERPHENLEITSFNGLKLRAKYFPAEKPDGRIALCIHGYTSTGLNEFAAFSRFYLDRGVSLFLPDGRAHGESEGKIIGFGWRDRLDVKQWCELIAERFGTECRILLHGVSMGAATVMMASGEALPQAVRGIVSDCGYTSAWDEFATQMGQMFHLPVFPILPLASLVCRIRGGYSFKECSAVKQLAKAKTPFLFIHGGEDRFVPTQMVYKVYEACRADKELLVVEGAAHALSYHTDPQAYEAALERFMEKTGLLEPKAIVLN